MGHGVLNYTLAGDWRNDNDKFKINQETGQITTRWDLDHEGGGGGNCRPLLGSCADANNPILQILNAQLPSRPRTPLVPTLLRMPQSPSILWMWTRCRFSTMSESAPNNGVRP